jgi:hypothetical protein
VVDAAGADASAGFAAGTGKGVALSADGATYYTQAAPWLDGGGQPELCAGPRPRVAKLAELTGAALAGAATGVGKTAGAALLHDRAALIAKYEVADVPQRDGVLRVALKAKLSKALEALEKRDDLPSAPPDLRALILGDVPSRKPGTATKEDAGALDPWAGTYVARAVSEVYAREVERESVRRDSGATLAASELFGDRARAVRGTRRESLLTAAVLLTDGVNAVQARLRGAYDSIVRESGLSYIASLLQEPPARRVLKVLALFDRVLAAALPDTRRVGQHGDGVDPPPTLKLFLLETGGT